MSICCKDPVVYVTNSLHLESYPCGDSDKNVSRSYKTVDVCVCVYNVQIFQKVQIPDNLTKNSDVINLSSIMTN